MVVAERRLDPAPQAMVSNTAALVGARCVVAALGWVGTVLIVRNLSVEQWGRFSFVFSLLGLLAVFTELGLGRVAIKGLLDEGDPAAFAGALVTLRAVLGAVAYVAALGFVLVAGYPPAVVRATAVAGLVVVLATPSHAVEGVFQAHLRMPAVAVGNVLGQLSQLGLIAALAAFGGSVVLFCVPAVLCEVVVLFWRLHRVRGLQKIRLSVDLAVWRRLLGEAAPLAAGVVLATFYYRIDSVMLSKMDTFSAVGIYGVAYKFVDLLHYIPTAMLAPVLALLVRSWPDDLPRFADTFRRAMVLLAAGGVLVAAEFAVFARPLISLLYGHRYAVGAPAAALVVGAECLNAFGRLAMTVLVAMGRHKLYPVAALAGLVLNVALNLWLIPARSYEGAAMATMITEVAVLGVLLLPVMRMELLRPLPVRALSLIAVAGAVAELVALSSLGRMPWPAAAGLAAGAYLALVAAAVRRPGARPGSRSPAGRRWW